MRSVKRSKSQQDDLHALGKAIRDIRRAHGWSQQELAGFLGISRETVGHYERGKREPGSLVVLDISRLTSVNVTEIVLLNRPRRKAVVQPSAQTSLDPARSSWFRQCLEARQKLVCARQQFEREVYSVVARRWNEAHSGLFFGAAIAYLLRVGAIEFGFPFGTSAGSIDWTLIISFCTMALLLPFQVIDTAKFYLWYRKERP